MRRLAIIMFARRHAPLAPCFDTPALRLIETATAADDASAKEAFDTAREMGTVEAWNAFLESYPEGFHANLARAYLKRLGGGSSKPASDEQQDSADKASTGDDLPVGPNADLGGPTPPARRQPLEPGHFAVSRRSKLREDPRPHRHGQAAARRTSAPNGKARPSAFPTSSSAPTRRRCP